MDTSTAMELSTNAELTELLKAVASMADTLGPGGVVALLLACPLLMVLLSVVQNNILGRRMLKMVESHQNNTTGLWEKHRAYVDLLLEDRRKETADILGKLGEALGKTTRYYEDNVRLVEDYDKLANDQQAMIATVVSGLEQMRASIEMICKTVVVNK